MLAITVNLDNCRYVCVTAGEHYLDYVQPVKSSIERIKIPDFLIRTCEKENWTPKTITAIRHRVRLLNIV